METVEGSADFAQKSPGRLAEHMAPLSDQIRILVPALEKIDAASLEHDFVALGAVVHTSLDFSGLTHADDRRTPFDIAIFYDGKKFELLRDPKVAGIIEGR